MKVTCPHCGEEFDTTQVSYPDTPLGRAREAKAMSLNMAARLTGISLRSLRRMEIGKTSPRIPEALRLAKVYGVSIENLFPEPEMPEVTENEEEDDEFEDDDPMTLDTENPTEDESIDRRRQVERLAVSTVSNEDE